MTRGAVRLLWRDAGATSGFRAGVSLHSHTMHSRESLGFLPDFVDRVPMLGSEVRRLVSRYEAKTGKRADFSTAYWTPPLPGREAYQLERRQVEHLGLAAFVSLTDHDNIEAGTQLQLVDQRAPISVEWTVPFETTYFHIGVHNLPPSQAHDWMADLAGYTSRPAVPLLLQLLQSLDAEPGVLLVLNHPLWDQAGIGAGAHRGALVNLLVTAGRWIHALELNGLRPWAENQKTVAMARELNRTLAGGGDRHGLEPNSIINLTGAATFEEYVHQVRAGSNHVLFLPQYRDPPGLRVLQTVCDVMSNYPDLAGREQWAARIFYSDGGRILPLNSAWKNGGPRVAQWFARAAQIGASRRVRRLLRLWRDEDREFALPLAEAQD